MRPVSGAAFGSASVVGVSPPRLRRNSPECTLWMGMGQDRWPTFGRELRFVKNRLVGQRSPCCPLSGSARSHIGDELFDALVLAPLLAERKDANRAVGLKDCHRSFTRVNEVNPIGAWLTGSISNRIRSGMVNGSDASALQNVQIRRGPGPPECRTVCVIVDILEPRGAKAKTGM